MNHKKYYLWTIGCQMNAADSRYVASQLEALGFSPVSRPEDANIAVVNTCVVRQQAENKIYGRLGSLKTIKQRNPEFVVALMGCMVGVKEAPSLKKKFPFVDVFMSPSDTQPLLEYLRTDHQIDGVELAQHQRVLQDKIQDSTYLLPLEQRGKSVTAFVPIVLGCSHACTFCIIPYRRGIERSRAEEDILQEVRSLAEQGIREVMLLGQIVDRYGLDLPGKKNLSQLLQKVSRIDGIERVRFLTSHPNWMDEELLDTIVDIENVCPHIEIPIQSGNNQVLTNMKRGYTVEEYHTLIEKIRNRDPKIAIHTDIIVGFSGETEAQFLDTYRLIQEVEFDKVHISKYSTRPKTVAARKMVDDVSEEEKTRRRNMLDQLQQSIQKKKHDAFIGKTVSVLVEEDTEGKCYGRTPHNKIVFFENKENCRGQILPVTIKKASPFSFTGKKVYCKHPPVG